MQHQRGPSYEAKSKQLVSTTTTPESTKHHTAFKAVRAVEQAQERDFLAKKKAIQEVERELRAQAIELASAIAAQEDLSGQLQSMLATVEQEIKVNTDRKKVQEAEYATWKDQIHILAHEKGR